MGYDATPQSASLIEYEDDLESWCRESGGQVQGDTRCVFKGKDGDRVAVDITSTQTNRQNTITHHSDGSQSAVSVTDADRVILGPDNDDIVPHTVALAIGDGYTKEDFTPVAMVEEGTMRSVYGVRGHSGDVKRLDSEER